MLELMFDDRHDRGKTFDPRKVVGHYEPHYETLTVEYAGSTVARRDGVSGAQVGGAISALAGLFELWLGRTKFYASTEWTGSGSYAVLEHERGKFTFDDEELLHREAETRAMLLADRLSK